MGLCTSKPKPTQHIEPKPIENQSITLQTHTANNCSIDRGYHIAQEHETI